MNTEVPAAISSPMSRFSPVAGTTASAKVSGVVRFHDRGQHGRFVSIDPAEVTSVQA